MPTNCSFSCERDDALIICISRVRKNDKRVPNYWNRLGSAYGSRGVEGWGRGYEWSRSPSGARELIVVPGIGSQATAIEWGAQKLCSIRAVCSEGEEQASLQVSSRMMQLSTNGLLPI